VLQGTKNKNFMGISFLEMMPNGMAQVYKNVAVFYFHILVKLL
jgi:hypothetical protein